MRRESVDADFVGIDLGRTTQDNGVTCPTQLLVRGPRGGHELDECDSLRNDATIRNTRKRRPMGLQKVWCV